MSDAPDPDESGAGEDGDAAESTQRRPSSADGPAGDREGAPDVADAERDSADAPDAERGSADTSDAEDLDALRREVEEKYDFENFGPADMAEMTLEEWEVAFDPETWITGEELLDRVEDDLAARVADREVFARIERRDEPPRLVAYSDEGYAVVYPDGSVDGEGTVLRDVKPSVALSSMESYDVPEPPADATLPEPEEVPEQSGELGNLMLQVVAGMQVLAALVLFGAGVFTLGDRGSNAWLLFGAGIAFLIVGLLLFFTVANARLSDAFRAEEYRNRLRAVGTGDDDRPDFLPPEAGGPDDDRTLLERTEGADGAESRTRDSTGTEGGSRTEGARTGDARSDPGAEKSDSDAADGGS